MNSLTQIIKEAGILDKVAFGDDNYYPKLAKMQGAKPGSEPNNSFEDRLFDVINRWTGGPNNDIVSFQKHMPILARQYPQIFKPETPIGTILYRGLEDISDRTSKYLIANSTANDWIKMKENFWLCKIPIQYNPHWKAQSWTDKISIAQKFGGAGLLVTKQDSNFYLNKKAIAVIFGENEHEIVHFGKEYSNHVYIAIEEDVYQYEILPKMTPKSKKIGFKNLSTFYKSKKK